MAEMIRQGDVRRPTEVPRISERYAIEPIPAVWSPPTKGRFSTKPRPTPMKLIDLSVAGARILSLPNPEVRVGMKIPIELGDERGVVEVRNVVVHGDDAAYFGVVFHKISDRLQRAVFAAVGKRRNAERLTDD